MKNQIMKNTPPTNETIRRVLGLSQTQSDEAFVNWHMDGPVNSRSTLSLVTYTDARGTLAQSILQYYSEQDVTLIFTAP